MWWSMQVRSGQAKAPTMVGPDGRWGQWSCSWCEPRARMLACVHPARILPSVLVASLCFRAQVLLLVCQQHRSQRLLRMQKLTSARDDTGLDSDNRMGFSKQWLDVPWRWGRRFEHTAYACELQRL